MAVKSILEIDLRDARFLAFKRVFDQYRDALAKLPAQWRLAGGGMDAALARSEKRMTVGQKLLAAMADEAKNLNRHLAGSEVRWASLDRITLRVLGNVRDMTGWILKWGSITGVVSGLAGAGGLWGLDRLAHGVGSTRRSSFGLGAQYGDVKAFGANFSRLVDPDAFLSAVSGAKTDVTRRVGLVGAGLTPQEMAGDTAQTALALLHRLKTIADTTNPALFAQVIQSRRLDQFVSTEDLQRLRRTSRGELGDLTGRYGQNRSDFAVPEDVQRKWQDFATQMTRAGQGIENTFVRGLAPLTPGLTRLSDAVDKVVKAFMSSPALGSWIEKAGKGLETFAEYVGTEKFRDDVKNFAEGIGKIAKVIGNAFGWVTGADPQVSAQRTTSAATRDQLREERRTGGASAWSQLGGALTAGRGITPDALLEIVRKSERSGPNAVSPKGAIGTHQIMPDTALQYGMDPSKLFDPAYNEATAKKVLADLIKRYHGNTDQILAAYNAGPGRANRFRDAGGDLSVLPEETQRYIGRARGMSGYSPTVVTIQDTTGGNVNVSVNGLKE